MSFEDNDNLYILEEEREIEEDETPRNFAAYDSSEEIDDEEEIDDNVEETRKVSAFGVMIKIMFSPVEGWKQLRRNHLSTEKIQAGCFFPLLAILAVSKFAEFFYSVNVNLSKVITDAVVDFVAFYFGYFCLNMLLQKVLPKDMVEKFNNEFGKNYLLISLSTLVLFSILMDLFPMIWPILFFLPLWTVYIMFKGTRFFKFAQNREARFLIFAAGGAIGIPLLISWVLNEVMPY